MTDIVGRGQAHGYHISGLALTQLHFIDHRRSCGQYRPVKIRGTPINARPAFRTLKGIVANRLAIAMHDFGAMRDALRRDRISRTGFVNLFADRLVQRCNRRQGLATFQSRKPLAFPPVNLVNLLAAHHQRGPVLARYRHIAGFGRYFLQPFAERRNQQMPGRSDIFALGGSGDITKAGALDTLVFGTIDGLVVALDRQVDPVVADDPGASRMDAGHDRRMARAGFG